MTNSYEKIIRKVLTLSKSDADFLAKYIKSGDNKNLIRLGSLFCEPKKPSLSSKDLVAGQYIRIVFKDDVCYLVDNEMLKPREIITRLNVSNGKSYNKAVTSENLQSWFNGRKHVRLWSIICDSGKEYVINGPKNYMLNFKDLHQEKYQISAIFMLED